ncbi:hypothetical protein [uncultured Pantoea sp.]|uniref:hypothetical protein n=1 Tax=uncultured Pantoea sp. TaxID=218084 RepID=UPI00258DF5E7|nr:hypothetical protein [uncultured Pantoea sp.]
MSHIKKKIYLTEAEAIDLYKEIDYILVSLNNIAHYYYNESTINEEKRRAYERETTNFIDDNDITTLLSKMRGMIGGKFDREPREDDMDDLERATENTKYWEGP